MRILHLSVNAIHHLGIGNVAARIGQSRAFYGYGIVYFISFGNRFKLALEFGAFVFFHRKISPAMDALFYSVHP